MSTPSVEILSRAEWPGQGRREECEVSAPRAHLWGREEEKVGILSHNASPRAQIASGWARSLLSTSQPLKETYTRHILMHLIWGRIIIIQNSGFKNRISIYELNTTSCQYLICTRNLYCRVNPIFIKKLFL